MPNSDSQDRFVYPILKLLIDSYIITSFYISEPSFCKCYLQFVWSETLKTHFLMRMVSGLVLVLLRLNIPVNKMVSAITTARSHPND